MSALIYPEIVDTEHDLKLLVDALRESPIVAVDTESNSLYAYYEQVCLIQISVPYSTAQNAAIHDFIVDPLAIDDLNALGELFADPTVEIVFHAAEYDIMGLKRDFGFEFANLFDTYIAAKTLGWERVGLSSLLEAFFDVKLDKRFQQADWSYRPLPADQLAYAQMDTHYLPALREHLHLELLEAGYLEEARELFDAVAQVEPGEKQFDPDGFWRIRKPKQFNGRQMAILKVLYLWREQMAAQRNLPPFKVLGDHALVAIAKSDPQALADLQSIKALPNRKIDRYGRSILAAVAQGRRQPAPRPKPQSQPDPHILSRYDALHTWRKRKALARGVDSDIILSKDALWALVHRMPMTVEELAKIPEIGPYRRQQYASELLDVLAEFHN